MEILKSIFGKPVSELRSLVKRRKAAKDDPEFFVGEEIRKLNELRKKGIITDKEYKAQKQRLNAVKNK